MLKGLYDHLKANSSFNTSLGGGASTAGRIWYGQAKPQETLPYAVMFWVSAENFDAFDKDGLDGTFQVSIWNTEAAGPDAVADIGDNLLARLNGVSVSATGNQIITPMVSQVRGPFLDEDAWRQDFDFRIQTHAT